MAASVGEIMNRELFSVRPEDSAEEALRFVLALDITGAPVVDDKTSHPLGMVSFRDLLRENRGPRVSDRMTTPAVVVRRWAAIADAAKLIAETGVHRLVVVDDEQRAVGVVSALDVLRGLIGHPVSHPASFPHYDQATGVTWTDDIALELERVKEAPDGPGVLLLLHDRAGVPETIVWGETVENVRTRLFDLLSTPQPGQPLLQHWLERGDLRFRAGTASDRRRLRGALDQMLAGPRSNGG